MIHIGTELKQEYRNKQENSSGPNAQLFQIDTLHF